MFVCDHCANASFKKNPHGEFITMQVRLFEVINLERKWTISETIHVCESCRAALEWRLRELLCAFTYEGRKYRESLKPPGWRQTVRKTLKESPRGLDDDEAGAPSDSHSGSSGGSHSGSMSLQEFMDRAGCDQYGRDQSH